VDIKAKDSKGNNVLKLFSYKIAAILPYILKVLYLKESVIAGRMVVVW